MAYTAAERLMNVMNNGLTVCLVLNPIALALRSITCQKLESQSEKKYLTKNYSFKRDFYFLSSHDHALYALHAG